MFFCRRLCSSCQCKRWTAKLVFGLHLVVQLGKSRGMYQLCWKCAYAAVCSGGGLVAVGVQRLGRRFSTSGSCGALERSGQRWASGLACTQKTL